MNNFLAAGGDGFTVFNQGTNALGGAIDLDALVAYFGASSPIAPGPQNRITPIPYGRVTRSRTGAGGCDPAPVRHALTPGFGPRLVPSWSAEAGHPRPRPPTPADG